MTDKMKTMAGEMETTEIECLDCGGTGKIDPYKYYSVNCYEEMKKKAIELSEDFNLELDKDWFLHWLRKLMSTECSTCAGTGTVTELRLIDTSKQTAI